MPSSAFNYLNFALEDDGVSIAKAAAFRSPQPYRQLDVFFIAGEVDGPGYEGEGDIAVWAQPGEMGEFMMVAVQGLAHEISVFGTAGASDIGSNTYPGVSQSVACLRAAER